MFKVCWFTHLCGVLCRCSHNPNLNSKEKMHLLFKVFAIVDSLFNVEPKPATKLFFRSNYWCVIQLSSQLFYQTLQKGLVERKKGKKWGLWNEIKGQSTNKVIKEIITFACRLSLCVIALFSESFCGNIAFKVSSSSPFWGWTLNQIEASLVSRKLPSSRLFLNDLTNTMICLYLHLI